MSKNSHISALNELGQSIWYDNLSRDVLNSGELKSLIDSGVSGLTSNPTIFKNAIADSNSYDDEMRELVKQGLSTDDICEELMVRDVGMAADLLRPIYDQTNGGDGHASIEVSPFLARDTAGTIEAAKRLWKKLNRPNIMIKIPATPEGIPAIRSCLEDGLNINVTLIFSRDVYTQVATAFIDAVEARAKRNQEINRIASVASFFVSRVDAICEKNFDQLLKDGKVKENDRDLFFGKIGIANSKLAYEKFEELFKGERFKDLRSKGCKVQRPLWASTGTKNPAFSPVMYVEELAGKDTVNTMPPATLKALISNANITGPKLHSGHDEAKQIISGAKSMGIPFDQLMLELQDVGVKLFADSFKELLDSIENKRGRL
ncbi:MAG: transaldolase [Deltaproteobacteria bacterium]|nr:transaldolase [Deltaproteobacteria bacterium]